MQNNSLFLICIFIILLDQWEKKRSFSLLIIWISIGEETVSENNEAKWFFNSREARWQFFFL